MTRDLTCCLAADTAQTAAQSMKEGDIGAVLVVDSQKTKRLAGIVTDRDLALKVVGGGLDPRQTRVEAVMAREMVMCAPDDDLQRALDAMSKHQLRRIPVVRRGPTRRHHRAGRPGDPAETTRGHRQGS